MTAETLREARKRYAEAPSHAPYGTYPDPDTVCVVTACNFTNGCNAAIRALARAAGITEDFPRTAVIKWNANASTDEVLAAFDRAIAAEESA